MSFSQGTEQQIATTSRATKVARSGSTRISELREISVLMESAPDPGTPDGGRPDILTTLVQAYEARHVPISPPEPIKFRMNQSGLSVKELEPIIGRSDREQADEIPVTICSRSACLGDPQGADRINARGWPDAADPLPFQAWVAVQLVPGQLAEMVTGQSGVVTGASDRHFITKVDARKSP